MMVTSVSPYIYNPPYCMHSTLGASDASQQLRSAFDNEWYAAAALSAGYENPPISMQLYIEPIDDYQCPDPIRSYKIKVRIVSKVKGEPTNYNEHYEDFL
jgi:hypothetical protein